MYPKAGKGRRPYPLAVMLRIHCVQHFYNLSGPGMEGLPYEAESVRRFVGQKLSGALPDETTSLNFRHRLEGYSLGGGLLQEINAHLKSQACGSGREPSSMPASSRPGRPPRTMPGDGTRRCIRRRMGASGISV